MKRNAKKTAVIVAVLLVFIVLYVASYFIGNPILYAVSKNAAQVYLEQHYETTDYGIKDIIFSQKRGSYNVVISSPSSIDTEFTLVMNHFGGIEQNTYDVMVSNKFNTSQRLSGEYSELVGEIIHSSDYPYTTDPYTTISFSRLFFHSDEEERKSTVDFSVDTNSLIMDKQLTKEELNEVAKKCGDVNITITGQEVSEETMVETVLEIKEIFDQKGVSFYRLTLAMEGSEKDASISFAQTFDLYYDGINQDDPEKVEQYILGQTFFQQDA